MSRNRHSKQRKGVIPLSAVYSSFATLFIWLVLCGFFPITNTVLATSLLLTAVIDRISMLSQVSHFSLFSSPATELLAVVAPVIITTALSLLILYMTPVFISVLAVHFPSITSSILALPALPYLASGLWFLQDHTLRHIIPLKRDHDDQYSIRQSLVESPFPKIPSDRKAGYPSGKSAFGNDDFMWPGNR